MYDPWLTTWILLCPRTLVWTTWREKALNLDRGSLARGVVQTPSYEHEDTPSQKKQELYKMGRKEKTVNKIFFLKQWFGIFSFEPQADDATIFS